MSKFNVSYVVEDESIADVMGQLAFPDGLRTEVQIDEIMISEVKDA